MSLDKTSVLKIIANKLSSDFQLKSFSIEPITTNGTMGAFLKIVCKVQEDDLKLVDHTFFVKKKPTHLPITYKETNDRIFAKEAANFRMFQTINLPTLNNAIPKCFYFDDQHLVLEDLIVDGYQCLTTNRVATEEELYLMLKTLAGMHAAGIAYEEQQTKNNPNGKSIRLDDKFPEAFIEIYFVANNKDTHPYLQSIIKGLETAIKVFKLPEVLKTGKRLEDELQRFWTLMGVKPSSKYRNVMSHCDLWPANIFIKYDKDGKPVEAKIVDYQIERYLPPALDVLDYILLNTTREYRQKNMLKLKEIYYDFFCKYLKEYEVDPIKIYTFDEFIESFKEIEFICLFMELNTIPMVYNSTQTVSDFVQSEHYMSIFLEDRSPLFTEFASNKYFMERVKDCLLDMVEYFENN